MMGQRSFGSKLYYQLSLDQLVPDDHLLRHISAAVDFSFVSSVSSVLWASSGWSSGRYE